MLGIEHYPFLPNSEWNAEHWKPWINWGYLNTLETTNVTNIVYVKTFGNLDTTDNLNLETFEYLETIEDFETIAQWKISDYFFKMSCNCGDTTTAAMKADAVGITIK